MVNYTYLANIEEEFTYDDVRSWVEKHWTSSFNIAALYLILLLLGKYVMKTRSRLQLQGALLVWNVALATFSILGCLRTLPNLWRILTDYGFHASVCSNAFNYEKPTVFWIYAFMLSKVPELGDTAFIVLRKQPLMFLHWYHHVTVLIYTWYSVANQIASGHWFVTMNLLAHSFMYSYYTLKSLKLPVPRIISMCITVVQLLQMVIGVYINIYTYGIISRGQPCYTYIENIRASSLMYFSYFLLFLHYFVRAYVGNRAIKCPDKKN